MITLYLSLYPVGEILSGPRKHTKQQQFVLISCKANILYLGMFESVSESVLYFDITDKTTSCSWYIKTLIHFLGYNIITCAKYWSTIFIRSESCLPTITGSDTGISSSKYLWRRNNVTMILIIVNVCAYNHGT